MTDQAGDPGERTLPLDELKVEIDLAIPSDVRYIERVVDLVRRQCAELAGVVLLRPARSGARVRGAGAQGAGVAGGVRTALGRNPVHAVTPLSFTTFTFRTPSRFNDRRNACNA